TIVRPSHTYNDFKLVTGVHGDNDAWQIICRIRDGKPVIIHGDGTSLWTVTHADDFAVGFAGLMGNPRAIGQAVHITSDDILTWNSIYKAIGRAVGKEPKLLHIASEAIVKHGPEFEGTLIGDKMHSVIFDNEKIRWLVPEYAPRIRFSDAVHTVVRNYL
ncbi:MAG: NAD-dependent dehydratase, partial [Planctomycetes bacterium]|nr:NAD-dependent dehydratase [Planctomycetota bacterium]